MPRFHVKYVARDGSRRAVQVDAIDKESLLGQIEGQFKGYVIEIRKTPGKRGLSFRTRISCRMLLTALDSLELMLLSNVRVNMAIRKIAECAPPGNARRLWTEVALMVEETGSLGQAFERFPRVFNESMIGVVFAHETAGNLAGGIRTMRNYVAQMQEIKRESARGAAYPLVVCSVGVASAGILCVFTLPRFSHMLADIGATKTNRVTAFFFGISDFVTMHPCFTLLALSFPFTGIWLALRPRCRPAVDHFALRLPILRNAIEALVMARVCITFKALSESGVRVVEALEACATAAGNVAYSSGIRRVVAAVRENASVGSGFARAGIFAPEVVLAVKSGEGCLPEVFGRLADYYSNEARHRVSLALRLVEPVMLLFVLAWVLGIALAVILPMVEIIDGVR